MKTKIKMENQCEHNWEDEQKIINLGRKYIPGEDWETPYYIRFERKEMWQRCKKCNLIELRSSKDDTVLEK